MATRADHPSLASRANWPLLYAAIAMGWVALWALHMATGHGQGEDLPVWAVFAMWGLMAGAMMLPTALPMLRAYDGIIQAARGRLSRYGLWGFAAGYVLVWWGFSLVAATLQITLVRAGALTTAGASTATLFTAGLFLLAGAYQFAPTKRGCVNRCRTPMAFLMSRWREGARGALALGVRHGADCVGCCAAIMGLAFVGGLMNPLWMALATIIMAVEKLPQIGRYVTRPLGAALLVAGAGVAISALA